MPNAQSTWQFFHKNANEEEQIVGIEEIKNNDIVTISHVIHVNGDENKAKGIIRFHHKETGEVYKKQEYKVDSLATKFEKLYYNKISQTFTIIGSAFHKGVNSKGIGYKRGYLLITHWDYDLNLLKDTTIALEPYYGINNYLWYIDGNRTKNGDLLLMGISTSHLIIFDYHRNVLFIRLNKKGEILKRKWYKRLPYDGYKVSIIENREQNGYISIGKKVIFLNNDFDKIDSITTFNTIDYIPFFNCTAKLFSEDNYMISVLLKNNRNKGLAIFDKNFNIIKKVNISRPMTNSDLVEDFSLARRAFDYIDTSAIYIGAQDIWYKNHTLAKVNSKLEPIWIKYLSMDDTLGHLVWTMKATNDGGCILVGSQGKYRKGNLPKGRGAWMKKFDSNGNSVGIQENHEKSWEITVFPNPSQGEFIIEIDGNAQKTNLQLFDMQGRKVKDFNNLVLGKNHLNMYNLFQGMYIWKLEKNGKIIGDGKWFKK
jgi:hypothetical protein